MVLGELCTRGCRFCAVSKSAKGSLVDPLEPIKLANVVKKWGLSYIVITSVCRDDLEDLLADRLRSGSDPDATQAAVSVDLRVPVTAPEETGRVESAAGQGEHRRGDPAGGPDPLATGGPDPTAGSTDPAGADLGASGAGVGRR